MLVALLLLCHPKTPIKGLPAGKAIVTGKTGSGKSQLICTLFGDPNIVPARQGLPTTWQQVPVSRPGIAVTLVDTPGFEVRKPEAFNDLIAEFQTAGASANVNDHYYACLLCINEGGNRIEECDIAIAEVCRVYRIPVIVVMTHRRGNTELRREAEVRFPGCPIIPVDSKAWTDEDGNYHAVKGIDELVAELRTVLEKGRRAAAAEVAACRDLDGRIKRLLRLCVSAIEMRAIRAGARQVTNPGATASLKVLYSLLSVDDAQRDIVKECTAIFGLPAPDFFITQITDRWQASREGKDFGRIVESGTALTDQLEKALARQNPDVLRSATLGDLERGCGVEDSVTILGLRYCRALAILMEDEGKDLSRINDPLERIRKSFKLVMKRADAGALDL